ncbi:MAG: hypothetical protein ACI8S6_005198 [Myxococcota bacterium]|jgi:hypothetical protein
MKRTSLITAAILSLSFALSAPAEARSSSIGTVGVAAFDGVFVAARGIDDTVITAQQERQQARRDVNTSMSLDPKTRFPDALSELRVRIPSGVQVAVRNGVPSLQAGSAVPQSLQDAVNAVNSAAVRYGNIVRQFVAVPQQCQQLVGALSALNLDRLRADLAIESPEDAVAHLGQLSVYQTNFQTIGKMPQKVQKLVQNLCSDIDAIRSVFAR